MNSYKFQVTIPQNGVLQIPKAFRFPNQEVEIVIKPKQKISTRQEKAAAIKSFVSEWSGVLKDQDPDALKTAYLQEKYG